MTGPATRRDHGQLEHEILLAIAAAERPLVPLEIHEAIGGTPSYKTVHTVLTRLVDKGLLARPNYRGRAAYDLPNDADSRAAEQLSLIYHSNANRHDVLRLFIAAMKTDDTELLRQALDQGLCQERCFRRRHAE